MSSRWRSSGSSGQTFAVRATGVYSNTFNIYKIANNLRPASVYNIPITNPDPGPDARLGHG